MAKRLSESVAEILSPAANANRFLEMIDPAHNDIDKMSQLTYEVWHDKYRWGDEKLPSETFYRVCKTIYADDEERYQHEAYDAMCAGLWMPGGRIIAGAGTGKRVTLMNCYVNQKLEDSLDDIMQGVSVAALTQQQGGGIGTDFSTLRPRNAVLHRTGAKASGPLPFMDMWDAMCATIMSSGDRRGAMMATMCDTHPDLPDFIKAKHTKGRLQNFNVSILVSDALMAAVSDNEDWVLYFEVVPATRDEGLAEYDFVDEQGTKQYVYSIWKAQNLWDLITKSTYEYSEPGVIFIDRINDLNNLQTIEHIHCTNPCGEQPLPPNGTCNLGAINLSRLVKRPFKDDAQFNWELLKTVTRIGMRFLDNVIEVTNYPLPAQGDEERSKRRTGLGVSGLADALAQLGLRYGTASAATMTEQIMRTICLEAYKTSHELSTERGSFPLFSTNADWYLSGTFAGRMLPEELKDDIKTGIRNGVLLTIAPTGTTSILFGNISSGIEPVFAHKSKRRVRQNDNTFKEYDSLGYNYWLYGKITGQKFSDMEIPSFMVESEDLTIENHVVMQAAAQRWIDASVSKTINVSTDTTYEQFQKVYELAYTLGCKGCTTYRPSEVRGSILSRVDNTPTTSVPKLAPRSEILTGITHKVKWPSMSSALYITINHDSGVPYEVFFNSKDARYQEWWTALSLMISAILRKADGDVSFIGEELGAVHSVHDTAWIQVDPKDERRKWFGSLIAYIGFILQRDFTALGDVKLHKDHHKPSHIASLSPERCPSCFAPALLYKEGCKTCGNCGFSDCT